MGQKTYEDQYAVRVALPPLQSNLVVLFSVGDVQAPKLVVRVEEGGI